MLIAGLVTTKCPSKFLQEGLSYGYRSSGHCPSWQGGPGSSVRPHCAQSSSCNKHWAQLTFMLWFIYLKWTTSKQDSKNRRHHCGSDSKELLPGQLCLVKMLPNASLLRKHSLVGSLPVKLHQEQVQSSCTLPSPEWSLLDLHLPTISLDIVWSRIPKARIQADQSVLYSGLHKEHRAGNTACKYHATVAEVSALSLGPVQSYSWGT